MKMAIIAICSVLGVAIAINQSAQSTTKESEKKAVMTINDQNSPYVSPDNQDLKTVTLLSSEPESEISGKFMEAFLIGYQSFINDPQIPSEKKRLEHYTIEFRQDNEFYYLTFAGIKTPSDSPGIRGGQYKMSKSVIYIINKKDKRMVSRKFYK